MKIRGIDFVIGFWVFENSGGMLFDSTFEDFDELNAWLASHKDDFDTESCHIEWGFLEASDGETGSICGCWTRDSFEPFDEDEMGERTGSEEDLLFEQWDEATNVELLSRDELVALNCAVGDRFDRPDSQEYVRVCPRCFSPAGDCACGDGGLAPIQVDASIAEALRTLNQKGYVTSYSCGGHVMRHPDGRYGTDGVYVALRGWRDSLAAPKGGHFWKKGQVVRIDARESFGTREECEAFLREAWGSLLEWASGLEEDAETFEFLDDE